MPTRRLKLKIEQANVNQDRVFISGVVNMLILENLNLKIPFVRDNRVNITFFPVFEFLQSEL